MSARAKESMEATVDVQQPSLENAVASTDSTIPQRRSKKPRMELSHPPNDLLSRLNTLLPQMKAAHEELEREKANGTIGERSIENVGDDEAGYIEMNLGLGVLEHVDPNDDWSSSSSSSSSDSEGEPGMLAKLLESAKRHGKGPRGKPSLEEVTDAASTPTPGTPIKLRKKALIEEIIDGPTNGSRITNGKDAKGDVKFHDADLPA